MSHSADSRQFKLIRGSQIIFAFFIGDLCWTRIVEGLPNRFMSIVISGSSVANIETLSGSANQNRIFIGGVPRSTGRAGRDDQKSNPTGRKIYFNGLLELGINLLWFGKASSQ
jgi:hypothetical protein